MKSLAQLEKKHIEKIFSTYKNFDEIDSFSKIISIDDVIKRGASLNIAQYVTNVNKKNNQSTFNDQFYKWKEQTKKLQISFSGLLKN